jgi:hypothetical protein
MFTFDPVAISAVANSTSSPPCSFARLLSASSDITFVRVSSSIPFSSYHDSGLT